MKIAVIGAWHVHTQEYAQAILKNPQAQLACLWDDDQARGQAMAQTLGVPFQPDLEAIWADSSIQGIQVTTATNQHKEVLLAAAKAGKHIFTEKVLALTNEDAQEIAQAIRESGVTFTISYPHKCRPALKAAKALVESGKLGQITYARVHNYHNGSVAPQADGSLGWLPPHFYDEVQTGGGAMMDLGAHPMYTLHWFLGEPKSVVSQFTQVTHRGVEDNAVSVLEFEGGAIGVSETGFVTSGNGYFLELSGTQGSLHVFGDHGDRLEYSCPETGGKTVEMTGLPQPDTMPIDAWIAACCGQGQAPNGIDEAVALTQFMVGAYESYRTGQKYTFPSAN